MSSITITIYSEHANPILVVDPLADGKNRLLNVISTFGCNVNGVQYPACGQTSYDVFNYVTSNGRLELPLLQSILENVVRQDNGVEMLKMALEDQRQRSGALTEMLIGLAGKIDALSQQMTNEFASLRAVMANAMSRDGTNQIVIESGYGGDTSTSDSDGSLTPRRTRASRVTVFPDSAPDVPPLEPYFMPEIPDGPLTDEELDLFSAQFGMTSLDLRTRLERLGPLEPEHLVHFRKMMEDVRPVEAKFQDAFVVHDNNVEEGIFIIPSTPGLIPPEAKHLILNPGGENECPLFAREVVSEKWRFWVPCLGGDAGWTFDSKLGKYFIGVMTFDGPDRTYAIELSLALLHKRGAGRGWTQEFVVFGRSGAHILRRFMNQGESGGEAEHEIAYAPLVASKGWRDAEPEFVTGLTEERLPITPLFVPSGRNLRSAVVAGLVSVMSVAGEIQCDYCESKLPPLAEEGPLAPLTITGRKAGSHFSRINSCARPSGSTHDMTLALWSPDDTALNCYYSVGRACAGNVGSLQVHSGKGTLCDRLEAAGMSHVMASWVSQIKQVDAFIPTYVLRAVVQARMSGKHSFNGRANLLLCPDGVRTICIHCGAIRSSIGDRQECEAYDIQIAGLGVMDRGKGRSLRFVRVGVGMTSDDAPSSGSRERLSKVTTPPSSSVRLSDRKDGIVYVGRVLTRAIIREARYLNHYKVFPRVT